MPQILAVRHSISAYPDDCLSLEGIALALRKKNQFQDQDVAIASPKIRTQQTCYALGYLHPEIYPEFNELELDDVNAPSAHEYVIQSHLIHPELVEASADLFLHGLKRISESRGLIVSHNLVLSGVLATLTGEITSFDNLSGMLLNVDDNISLIRKV
jgi:broad specificity phosphatase PhoE